MQTFIAPLFLHRSSDKTQYHMNHTVMFYCQFEIEPGPSWPCLQQCRPHFSKCSGLPSSQRNGLLSSAYVILRLHETPFSSTFLPQTRTTGLRTTWSDITAVAPTLSVSFCICYLSHCYDHTPDKGKLKEELLIAVYSLMDTVHHGRTCIMVGV